MDWEKWGLFISLVTPLLLGVGGWIINALSKRKKDSKPEVTQGLPVDYETDYIDLLKRNLAEARREITILRKENKTLRSKNGYSDHD